MLIIFLNEASFQVLLSDTAWHANSILLKDQSLLIKLDQLIGNLKTLGRMKENNL